MITETGRCDQCEAMMINGVFCHETGCPDAWMHEQECDWCGQKFMPEYAEQICCTPECATYNNGG